MSRLGSTAARLKLKGIDGGPHKRWSMWFNSTQRAEPYLVLTSSGSPRDGGVPFGEPRDRCYNGRYKAQPSRETEPIAKNRSQFGLKSATRLHEVGIASNRGSARRGEYVPGPCTHRPSHHGSQLLQKWLAQPAREGGP